MDGLFFSCLHTILNKDVMFHHRWRFRTALCAALGAALLPWAQAKDAGPGRYELESATVLPSTNTDWDYLAFDAARSYLFIARRGDGLTVFDVRTNKVVANVAGTKGANGVLLLPEFDRAYVANTDGTMTTIALSTLSLLKWEKLDDAGLNAIVYEPTTGEMHAITGARPKTSTYITLDAKTGKFKRRTEFDSTKMDTPASDGKGALYAPMRDKNVLHKLSASDLSIQQSWPLAPCEQPVAVEYDEASKRVLVGCRGDKPVFIAFDPQQGKVVASLPIGKGVDGMAIDHASGTIVTTSGADASMAVIRQLSPDRYELVENIATRPMARVLAMDPATKKLYTVAAGFTLPASEPGKPAPAPRFHPNSFTVLAYARSFEKTARDLHDEVDEEVHN
jgi:DNA-binding beta-propeller fold protein YncE